MSQQQPKNQHHTKAGLNTSTSTIKNLKQLFKNQHIHNISYTQYNKIILPALPGTFLLYNKNKKQIMFLNQQNQRLSSFYSQLNDVQITYLSSNQVLILQSDKLKRLHYWNLFQNSYKLGQTFQEVIFVAAFEKSKRACWIMNRRGEKNDDPILLIQHFQINPKTGIQSHNQLQISLQKQKPDSILTIRKLNNTSKIGIFTQTNLSNKQLQFQVYDLSQPQNKIISNFTFNHNIYPNSKIHQITLADIWLIDDTIFYLRFQAELDKGRYVKEGKPDLTAVQHQIQRQFQFIWDYKQNKVNYLDLGIPERFYHLQFANSLRKIPKTYKLYYKTQTQKQFLQLPVYLIYLISGQFQLTHKIPTYTSTNKTNKITTYELENRIIKYQFEQNQLKIQDSIVNQFLFPLIEIYAYFMECIVGDCDDDLIYLAVGFLCDGFC